MSKSLDETSTDKNMDCMEVWGGATSTDNHFVRPGLDLWIWHQARGLAAMGGSDVFFVSSCASGRITRTLLADVCGFGSMFSSVSGELRNLMKKNINSIRQSRFVRSMSKRFESASLHGASATAVIATYFAPTRSLALCNAGHPPPLLFRAKPAEWCALKRPSNPVELGDAPPGFVIPSEYQQFSIKLQTGDMFLAYSNIFTECQGAGGRVIGIQGLIHHLNNIDMQKPAELIPSLIHKIRREDSSIFADSDTTLLLGRVTTTPVRFLDNLLAPIRMMRAPSDRTELHDERWNED